MMQQLLMMSIETTPRPQGEDMGQNDQHLYEEAPKHSFHPRLFKSQLINKVFQQNSKGEYVLAPGNAQFQVFKKNSEIRTNKSQVTALPYSINVVEIIPGKLARMMQKDEVMPTAIEKKQGISMALHGGQANLTKDEYSQMSQFMSSRPWSQFGTGASGSGSSGSGSSACSTPAVVTSSSAFSQAICDAPVKLSWASVELDIKEAKGAQERLGRDCQRLAAKIFDKKEQNINDT